MSKPFLTPKEKEHILSAYSWNFKSEFQKIGSYAFGTKYGYTINMCPEVDNKGEKTGRILVNHYSLFQKPKFVDVWERGENGLVFLYRNLPTADISSMEAEIRELKEELKLLKRVEAYKGTLKGKKLSEYCKEITAQRDELLARIDYLSRKNYNYVTEKDTFFKESETYWELLYERDDAEREKLDAKAKKDYAEKRLREVTEEMIALSKEPQSLRPHTSSETHNARGAGRKPSSEVAEMREKVRSLKDEGKSRDEIMKEMGISIGQYYRAIREGRDVSNKG